MRIAGDVFAMFFHLKFRTALILIIREGIGVFYLSDLGVEELESSDIDVAVSEHMRDRL